MRRLLVVLVALAVLGTAGYAAWRHFLAAPKVPTREQARDALEEAVGLALKGVELVQGEKGVELWRLKATWAALRQEKGVIDVDSPDIIYKVGKTEEPLRVIAPKGEVRDNQSFIRLWDKVTCTYRDYVLDGTLMTYNSTSRLMIFPEGAVIVGATSRGNATRLSWNLATNVIEGEDGVVVHWSRADAAAPNASGTSGNPDRATHAPAETAPAAR